MFIPIALIGATLTAIFADAGGLGGFIMAGASALGTVALLACI